jgi:phytoene synthase
MISSAKEISKKSKSSFYYAFNLLPKKKAEAMNIFYAFCRRTDDLVDNNNPKEKKIENLENWRNDFEKSLSGRSDNLLLQQLSEVIVNFKIPKEHFFELIKGMEMDIYFSRYKNFEALKVYCYRVASTVGLISIEIFGYKNDRTKDFAVNLGIALQLTNILRDIKKDLEHSRIYIPLDEMEYFKYSENELIENIYNNNFINLMKFQVSRIKKYFELSDKYLTKDDKSNLFPAIAMRSIYFRLLQKIIKNNFNIFHNNIKLSSLEKFFVALNIWFSNKFINV